MIIYKPIADLAFEIEGSKKKKNQLKKVSMFGLTKNQPTSVHPYHIINSN